MKMDLGKKLAFVILPSIYIHACTCGSVYVCVQEYVRACAEVSAHVRSVPKNRQENNKNQRIW